MKTFAPILAAVLGCLPGFMVAALPVELASNAVILRVETVGPEALGLSAEAEGVSYVRVVARSTNGKFLVVVHSNAGIVRMQGAYLDSALAVEDGLFSYYHPNGRLESKGSYVAGVKTGIWVRSSIDGAQLPDRIYTGLSVDELVHGQTLPRSAGTVNADQSGEYVVGTGRRQSTPVAF